MGEENEGGNYIMETAYNTKKNLYHQALQDQQRHHSHSKAPRYERLSSLKHTSALDDQYTDKPPTLGNIEEILQQ